MDDERRTKVKPGFRQKGASMNHVAALQVVDEVQKFFLPEDLQALQDHIDKLEQDIESLKKEARETATQTSETWHDNFGFEDATKKMRGIKTRLDDLKLLLSSASVYEPDGDTSKVQIGRHVVIWDELKNVDDEFTIGGFIVLGEREDVVSYMAPLVQLIMGAKVGDIRDGEVNGTSRKIRIQEIS